MCTAIQIGKFKADNANSRLKWVKHLGKHGAEAVQFQSLVPRM